MTNTILSVAPPILVLIAVFFTKKLNRSLLLGIAAAALIATDGSPVPAIKLVLNGFYTHLTNPERLLLYAFLIFVSILVALINHTGSARAFAHALTKRLRTNRMVESATAILSSSLFIDDYLSILTTGHVMRPLTDRFSIARVKLAYLVHSLSGPLVIIAPISSWVATITSQLVNNDLAQYAGQTNLAVKEPFVLYLQTIPFIFYSFLTLVSVWFIINRRISYGPMHIQEKIAKKDNNLFGGKKPLPEAHVTSSENGSIAQLFVPITVLVVGVIFGILLTGEYHVFGGNNTFLQAVQSNTQTELILCCAGFAALVTGLFMALAKGRLDAQKIPYVCKEGIQLILPAIVMIILATVLSTILGDYLHTGQYLAYTVLGTVPITFLPILLFLLSIITAILTGSSWGTIVLLVPISVQMFVTYLSTLDAVTAVQLNYLLPILGSVLSGAVCGDHISPVSETTIMTATSAGCYPLDHVTTQFPYALPAIISTAGAFLLVSILLPYGTFLALATALTTSILICITLLYFFNERYLKEEQRNA